MGNSHGSNIPDSAWATIRDGSGDICSASSPSSSLKLLTPGSDINAEPEDPPLWLVDSSWPPSTPHRSSMTCCPRAALRSEVLGQLVPTSVTRCVRAFLVHDLGCALRQHMPLKAVLECASARKGEPVSAARGISIATLPMMFSECLVPRVGKHGGKEGPRYRQQSQDEGVRDRRLLRVSWHQG